MSLVKCKEEINGILEQHGNHKEALLPCLHAVQGKCGCITEEIVSLLAKKMDLPRVTVYSVATFYSMFSLKETGKYIIRICVSLPCYLKGSKEVLGVLMDELNIKEGETTADKKFTIETVSCLGICDQAPAMMINEKVFGNLTAPKVKEIINQYREK